MDVRVKDKQTGEIIEMSEYSFNLNRDQYELVGVESKINQRPVIEEKVEEKETMGAENIPSILQPEKSRAIKKTKK